MGLKNCLKRILRPNTHSSEAYLAYLKRCGIGIGEHCHVFSPETVSIDTARPYLLTVGNQVVITAGVTILTHDYSHTVMRKKYGRNIGDAQEVTIGDNVFIGRGSTILMGTHIGNNVIIGANAVVRGEIPDDVVVAGNPATVVCTLEAYYERRLAKEKERAVANVKLCRKRLHRDPDIREMGSAFAWLYLPRTEESLKQYPEFFKLPGEDPTALQRDFMASEPAYASYEEFLRSIE